MLLVWLVVATAGLLLSRWPAGLLSAGVNSVLLMTVGVIGTLTNAASFQVLRRLDDVPTRELSPERADRLFRVFERRRRSLFVKWGIAILTSITAAIGGGLLRLNGLQSHYKLILSISYVAFSFAITLGILIAVEYAAASKICRDLPREIEERKRKHQILARLRAPEQKPKTPA